ncbi:Hypothetical predicted protein [Mytilus galloprovincialis]|uniref:Uncharacterized protein n=1 Tax=Mytilus galloprovincialis TaxID=29158 RepID=A0A8B6CGM2_MYTGA|nr:Hypothetical predicted protein [Mytilus galloprovincialis]
MTTTKKPTTPIRTTTRKSTTPIRTTTRKPTTPIMTTTPKPCVPNPACNCRIDCLDDEDESDLECCGLRCCSIRQRFERTQDKSLVYDDKVSSLMQCLPFVKPEIRGEPLRRQNALELFNTCKDPIGQTPDKLWVVRRMICRERYVLPHV